MLYRLGSGSLASWDEAIYATVAKEVVRSGHWLSFTLDGQLWFDKPPLAIWFTALLQKIFGVNELSSRLFSALCGAGTVCVTYLFGRRLLNRWTAFIGALILLSSSHFLRFARFGMLDAPLTFFMTLAFFFFWLGHFKNRYLIFSGIAVGLAVLTKGFAALLIFPVVWLFCLFSGRLDVLGRSSYWIGVILAVAIALPWHLYELFSHPSPFLQDAVFKHLILRTTTALDGHAGGWYFYLRVLVNKFHPWILVAIFSAPFFLLRAVKDKEDETIFLSVWIFFILIALTAVRTKLAWYILPIYPALSLTAADFVARVFKESYALYTKVMFLVILALHVPYSNVFEQDYSRDIKGIAFAVLNAVPAEEPLFLYQYHEAPAVSFYLSRVSRYADSREDFLKYAAQGRFYCLIHAKELEELTAGNPSRLGLVTLASFENLRLVGRK